MNLWKFTITSIAASSLLTPSLARADILVTLTSTNAGVTSSQTVVEAGSIFSNVFTNIPGSLFTVNTDITSPGQLSSNINFLPSTLTSITVLVEEVTPGSTATSYTLQPLGPASPTGYSVATSASQTSGADSFKGNAIVSGNSVANASFTTAGGMTPATAVGAGVIAGPASSYTLGETYTLTNVSGYSLTNVGFTTTVSPNANPAALPEPSVLILTGLTTLSVGVISLRRQLRVPSA